MANDPAFLFYPGDYLRDTQCLSESVQVAYDRIICEHMRNICISKSQLNFFTKRLNDEQKDELMMVLSKVDGGFQINWVVDSIMKRRAYSDSRRMNRGKKIDKNKNNISKSYDSHMDNEIENVIEDVNAFEIVPPEKNEIPLAQQMHQLFIGVNQNYPKAPSKDFPAIIEIAMFIHSQAGGKAGEIFEMDVGEQKTVLDQWQKWCDWYKVNGKGKSLENIVKWKIQEVFSEIKNGNNGHNQTGKDKQFTPKARKTDSDYAGGF